MGLSSLAHVFDSDQKPKLFPKPSSGFAKGLCTSRSLGRLLLFPFPSLLHSSTTSLHTLTALSESVKMLGSKFYGLRGTKLNLAIGLIAGMDFLL